MNLEKNEQIDFNDNTNNLINKKQLQIGDIVKIGFYIIEGNKKRVQFFEGGIIAIKNSNENKTITVRGRKSVGVERIFPLSSPKIASIDIIKSSNVRRSKLYYLRKLVGKSARLKEKVKNN